MSKREKEMEPVKKKHKSAGEPPSDSTGLFSIKTYNMILKFDSLLPCILSPCHLKLKLTQLYMLHKLGSSNDQQEQQLWAG
eukprot:g40127.t1